MCWLAAHGAGIGVLVGSARRCYYRWAQQCLKPWKWQPVQNFHFLFEFFVLLILLLFLVIEYFFFEACIFYMPPPPPPPFLLFFFAWTCYCCSVCPLYLVSNWCLHMKEARCVTEGMTGSVSVSHSEPLWHPHVSPCLLLRCIPEQNLKPPLTICSDTTVTERSLDARRRHVFCSLIVNMSVPRCAPLAWFLVVCKPEPFKKWLWPSFSISPRHEIIFVVENDFKS